MVVKMMKVNEIRSKSVEELEKTLVDLKKDPNTPAPKTHSLRLA